MELCPECDGSGLLTLVGHNGQAVYREQYTCPLCGGKGVVSQAELFDEEQEAELQA